MAKGGGGGGSGIAVTWRKGKEFRYKDRGKTYRTRVEARGGESYVVVRNFRGQEITALRVSREYPLSRIAGNIARSLGS